MVKLLVRRLITTHCLNQVQLPSLVYHCRVTEYEYKTHQGLFQGGFPLFNPLPVRVSNSAVIRLGTNSGTITLEYDDRVRLMFTSDSSALLDGVGEYIRDSTTVNIIDNDCPCFSFITYIYTVFLFAQCWRSTLGNLNLYSRRALLVSVHQ